MDDLAHDIEVIRRWAATTPIVIRVWIFGSRARGDHRPDSDLDVAVEHDIRPGDADLFTTALCEPAHWKEELQPRARLELDVESYVPGDTLTVEAGINRSSRLVYERPSGNGYELAKSRPLVAAWTLRFSCVFASGDIVAVHTLADAAANIVSDLAESKPRSVLGQSGAAGERPQVYAIFADKQSLPVTGAPWYAEDFPVTPTQSFPSHSTVCSTERSARRATPIPSDVPPKKNRWSAIDRERSRRKSCSHSLL